MNEVADYVAQVRVALADLPPAARDELLEDLPEHLAEVAAEGEGSLADRLGPPAAYAAELRAAAGAPTGRGTRATLDMRLRDAAVKARGRLRVVDTRTGPLIGYEHASDFLRLLRPAWWVLRGYLVAMAVAYLLKEQEIGLLPRVDVGDRTVAGVLVLVGFVVASIWLGRRWSQLSPAPRLVLGVGTALLMFPAVISLFEADDHAQQSPYQEVSQYNGVESVYVFDDQGRPLVGARVFDQGGNQVQPGLWGCADGGVVVAEVTPTCVDPEPLGWPGFFQVGPVEEGTPERATPAPEPTATPRSTPTPEPSATPSSSPTPEPSATG